MASCEQVMEKIKDANCQLPHVEKEVKRLYVLNVEDDREVNLNVVGCSRVPMLKNWMKEHNSIGQSKYSELNQRSNYARVGSISTGLFEEKWCKCFRVISETVERVFCYGGSSNLSKVSLDG